jgi:uncharacterized membrane protein
MAFCAKCGASVAGGVAFCSACGAPVGATAGAGPAAAPMDSNVAALLSYVFGFITGIIFLVIDPYKNDRFVRFHAFQSIFLNVAVIIFWIAWALLSMVLGLVSLGLIAIMMWAFSFLIWLGVFVYWLFLMYKAYNNERYMIPFIGELAAKQAG